MKTKTAVERVKDLTWDSSEFKASIENLGIDYDEALKLAQELDAANSTLKEIAEWAGACDDNGFMPDGLRCSRQARRRLGVME